MQRLEVGGAVRPLKWPLGSKWLNMFLVVLDNVNLNCLVTINACTH
jgi:hypothetical protein